jgi:dihydrofolate reductase
MRNIILQVAVSLDGYIEGPNGEFDWCFTDQDYGMAAFFKKIDSMFLGRKSYELLKKMGDAAMPGFPRLTEYVFSNTLTEVRPGAVLINGDLKPKVEQIRNSPGKDIWLFGGASLTASLLHLNLIDEVQLAVHPILLGSGKLLFSNVPNRVPLVLKDTKTYNTGLVMLTYAFQKQL